MKKSPLYAFALSVLFATPALAHTGAGSVSGFASGFSHPMGGLDHLLAMIAVGVLAAQQGGKAVWLLPVSFVTMMVVGGALGIAGVAMPFVELGIVGSVIVLGAVIAKELAKFFLVICDAVGIDHVYELGNRVAPHSGNTKVLIFGKVVTLRVGPQIREVAASTARHQYF